MRCRTGFTVRLFYNEVINLFIDRTKPPKEKRLLEIGPGTRQ